MWRVDVAGRIEEQVTHIASNWVAGYEVARGQYLAYGGANGDALLLFPLSGGPARKLADCMTEFGIRSGASDVYYVDCNEQSPVLHAVDPASGRDRALGAFQDFHGGTVSISADEKVILYNRLIWQREADLMLIEGFK
jgi:hypothetical protein